MVSESLLKNLDAVDDFVFNRETFMNELLKTASREDLTELIENLQRNCVSLKTERISYINDKYPEVIDAIQILTQVEDRINFAKNDLKRISNTLDGMADNYETMKNPKSEI